MQDSIQDTLCLRVAALARSCRQVISSQDQGRGCLIQMSARVSCGVDIKAGYDPDEHAEESFSSSERLSFPIDFLPEGLKLCCL